MALSSRSGRATCAGRKATPLKDHACCSECLARRNRTTGNRVQLVPHRPRYPLAHSQSNAPRYRPHTTQSTPRRVNVCVERENIRTGSVTPSTTRRILVFDECRDECPGRGASTPASLTPRTLGFRNLIGTLKGTHVFRH